MALTSGADGLSAIRHIIRAAPEYLQRGGWLLFEHGHDQGVAVRDLFAIEGFVDVETRQDDESRERISLASWR